MAYAEKIVFVMDLKENKIFDFNNELNNLIFYYSINKNKIKIIINNYNNFINYYIIKNFFNKYKILGKINKKNNNRKIINKIIK